ERPGRWEAVGREQAGRKADWAADSPPGAGHTLGWAGPGTGRAAAGRRVGWAGRELGMVGGAHQHEDDENDGLRIAEEQKSEEEHEGDGRRSPLRGLRGVVAAPPLRIARLRTLALAPSLARSQPLAALPRCWLAPLPPGPPHPAATVAAAPLGRAPENAARPATSTRLPS
nr:hypothetical protein [Tanacetum cinerariifolium]